MRIHIKDKYLWFVAGYVALNLINAILLNSGVFHHAFSGFKLPVWLHLNAFFGNLAAILLFFGLAELLFRTVKGKMRFLLAITFLMSLLTTAHSVYSSIFSTYFSFSHLVSFKNPTMIKFIIDYALYAISVTLRFSQLFYLFPYFFLLFYFHFLKKTRKMPETIKPSPTLSKMRTYIFISFVTISVIVMATTSLVYKTTSRDDVYYLSGNPLHASSSVGTYHYLLSEGMRTLFGLKNHPEVTTQDQEDVENFLQDRLITNPQSLTNDFTNIANGMNLVIIQLEAINNFLIGLEVNGIEVTPNLNRIASESVYFDNFYSTAGMGNTSDTELSALTALYPMGQNVAVFEFPGSNYDTLPKQMKSVGYETFSLHGNVGSFYARKTSHISVYGFDNHYDMSDFSPSYYLNTWVPDDEFLLQTVDILKTHPSPFFAFPITISVHWPFLPSEHIPTIDFEGVSGLARRYLHSASYLDSAIGAFFDKMKQEGLYDNTVFVLLGDHTSSLFKREMEMVLRAGGRLPNGTFSDFDYRREMPRVPFIIHAPSILPNDKISLVRSIVDIYPTLANLFGVVPKYRFGIDALSSESTFAYSPRNFDVFYDTFMIHAPSEQVHFFGESSVVDKKSLIDAFVRFKRNNDLLFRTMTFQ